MQEEHIIDLEKAFNAKTAEEFLMEVFPRRWKAIAARIVETGAEFSTTKDMDGFAPGWSHIPKTIRWKHEREPFSLSNMFSRYSKTGDIKET